MNLPDDRLHFSRPAMVLKQPLLVAVAVARRLAAMGAWPAERRHHTLMPSAAVQVTVGTCEPLT